MIFVIFKNIVHLFLFINLQIILLNYSSNISYLSYKLIFLSQSTFYLECIKNYQRNITFFHHLPSELRYQRSPLTGNPPGEGEKRNGSKPRVAHRGVACNSTWKRPLLSTPPLCRATTLFESSSSRVDFSSFGR